MDSVNQEELKSKVKEMYKKVAEEPHGEFHFEMGRELAEKLGYSKDDLDIKEGERVLDLTTLAKVGQGKVIDDDMAEDMMRGGFL